MKKKKLIISAVIAVILIVGLVLFLLSRQQPEPPAPEPEQEKNRITEPVNVIPVTERPYMTIKPIAGGRNIVINVYSLNKPATDMEYELEYQSGSLLQGAFGMVAVSDLPVNEKKMLGSCSAGGACTYHEDVKGGSLLMRFTGEEKYVLKSDWRFIDNTTRETDISSRDAKFQLSSQDLASERYLIVFNSPGIPDDFEAEAMSEVYTVEGVGPLNGTGELTMRANREAEEMTIYGYDGSQWQGFESTTDGKSVTAEVELMEAYVVGS